MEVFEKGLYKEGWWRFWKHLAKPSIVLPLKERVQEPIKRKNPPNSEQELLDFARCASETSRQRHEAPAAQDVREISGVK